MDDETTDRDQQGVPMLSVVAPMRNEAGGAAILVSEIAAALSSVPHEIIIVDDASTDDTGAQLAQAAATHKQLRVLHHEHNAGQSRALRTGILNARADVIVTLDGDGQNDPADIVSLHEALIDAEGQVTMVAGERRTRKDTAAKKFASQIANTIRRRIFNDGAADTGCGLKAFYRDAYLQLPYFDHMHRYIPALMRREGYEIAFVPVSHRARAHGVSKYTNFGRLAVAFRDLLGVLWLNSRAKKPGKITEDGPKKRG